MIRMPLMFSLRDVSNIKSETPREKIWEYLLRFGDRRFLETYWQNVPDSAFDSVSTLIKQAHEFRQASKYVTLLTRPLLCKRSINPILAGSADYEILSGPAS